ncbi:MAG: Asp-tRNA(Asn)/Glu-tRNA(Gln) amidotransferase GatCAB subunit C, partial [Lachnospiraceae bacterium]|nr:Asp-tRNA(Asn)/Glu-tRNA(Gln) amidotransferase GatCAB subunit C [Lachnospiraceae bacterium]
MQFRTHTCGELRGADIGKNVTISGWYENLRKVSKNLGFLVLRDFYGVTQVVIETEEMMEQVDALNTETTLMVEGTVRERSSKNEALATGEIEVVPEKITVLGRC